MREVGILVLLFVATTSSPAAAADEQGEAKALVERWLKDQNTANFDDYATLYAERFFGIRRSGPREVHFDRAGWMKDRRRMFNPKRPTTVTIEGLVVHPTPTGAEVTFTQKFAQGTYRDSGTKQMLLRREGQGMRIADERMLDSAIESAGGGSAALDSAAWKSAVGIVTREGVVLPYKANHGWVTDAKPRVKVSRDGRQVTRFGLREDRLPSEARALVGENLELTTNAGKTCTAKVKRLALVAVVAIDTQFSERGAKVEPIEYEADAEADAARLVAELDGGCNKALIARRPGSAAPIVTGRKVDPKTEAAAVAAAHALPNYATLGAKEGGAQGPWELETEVRSFDVMIAGKQQHWVSVTLYGEPGCGATVREQWTLFALENGKLTLLNDPSMEAVVPSFLLDLDGDDRPEVIFDRGGDDNLGYDLDAGVARRKAGRLQTIEKVRNRYLGCPC